MAPPRVAVPRVRESPAPAASPVEPAHRRPSVPLPGARPRTVSEVQHLQRTLGNRAVGNILARSGGAPAIQRMVIRIRDVAEMLGLTNSTIMNASKDIKKGIFDPQDVQGNEDVGINQAVGENARKLGNGETLVVVAHGSAPSVGNFLRSGAPTLGGYSGSALAAKVAGLFPQGYNGHIYMDGCYTGKRLKYGEGTSFIEIFAAALAELRPDISFTVQGNIGLAATGQNGIEYITITPEEAEIARRRGWNIIEQDKNGTKKYIVASPFGQAYVNEAGSYNDMGLSETAQAIAKERDEEQSRQRVYPHPLMSQKEQDEAWNTLL